MKIERQVLRILSKNLGFTTRELKELGSAARFDEDLGVDSLDSMMLLFDCEDKFGLSINDNHWHMLLTVGDLCEYIEGSST